MYRTNAVKLSVIPALAYRQRLTSGGSGITILRPDAKQPGIASISKTSGEAIPAANTPEKLYPAEAFAEAIALTAGMPYRKQKNIRVTEAMVAEPIGEETEEKDVVIDSSDYQKIVEHYTDKNGKLSYDLINRDMIKFAHSSSIVREMIAEGEGAANIRGYITGMKFRNITENRDLTDDQVQKISELLDEVSPKGVYKELNSELRKLLKK